MFHTVVYEVTALAATLDTDGTAVTDSIETIQNGHIVPQVDKQLIYAWAGCVGMIRTKITSPNIRQLSPIQLRPIDVFKTASSRPPIVDFRNNPPTLKALEEIQVQFSTGLAGPVAAYAVLGLQVGGMTPAPQGMPIIMRGTGTTGVNAQAWTGAAITWADSLAQGTYAVVGFHSVSATGVAARLIFDQQPMRPGSLCQATDAVINSNTFLHGGVGVYGTFNAFRMPNVEFFCDQADAAQEVFLEFVRIA